MPSGRPPVSAVIGLLSACGVLLTLAVLKGIEPGFVPASIKARFRDNASALLTLLTFFSLATVALLLVLRLDGLWRALGAALQGLFLLWLSLTILAGLAVLVLVSGIGPESFTRGALSCPWLETHWTLPLAALLFA